MNIFIWSLLDAHNPAISGHLGIAIDIDTNALFGGKYSQITCQPVRKVSVKSKQAHEKYIANTLQQVKEHKVLLRAKELHATATLGPLTEEEEQKLYRLDAQMTEITLGAEKRCSK